MRKTVMYMLLAAAVLGMGGCGKADQPASADNGGTGAKGRHRPEQCRDDVGPYSVKTP